MHTRPRSHLLFTFILVLALLVSCAPRVTVSLPTLSPTVSPSSSTATAEPTSPPKQRGNPQKTPRAAENPSKDQGSNASQNLSQEVPAHPIDVILGRPTQNSITLSILAYQDFEGYVEYGQSPENYPSQTPLTAFQANQPVDVVVNALLANTAYTYRIRYRAEKSGDFSATDGQTFTTQRPVGSTFTFTIQADSHLDSNSSPQVYLQTLANEVADQPDFQIDLGDTFMTNKYQPYADAQAQYLAQRYYLGLIGQTAPPFLVLGNHDGEGAARNGTADDMSVWSAKMRTLYFPNPVPDDIYTGNATPDKTAGLLEDYYAWEWGGAVFIVLDPYWFTPPSKGTSDNWNTTLGEAQYRWLENTLEASHARWKFVFIHQLVGGLDQNGRGGAEAAKFFEWGGYNLDGSWGFDQHRPDWSMPIHQLLVANHVTAVFHGHDHLFVKQELDGIIYQEVPQPSTARSDSTDSAAEYGYVTGDILGSPGHLRVTVMPDKVMVDYIRAYLPQDEKSGQQNGQIDFSYMIK
jgi:hypothetical protein